mmetsp:Transcript_39595/g.77907  ORF Transcript_39595/g.77907 Transcript_39595/m.77907 type:complete len:371 (-) Transcript_39595:218-1330(-)|eukprot:CAMPEP_0175090820 /NCGR_PEP_ID=MMETSP0086_2-20121207/1566_1 /TAXON_ID=136419 /ORGANISM="Unknown Unknown, Strain D1" /LENGTH=370 /DNA_ID=CAMNT_0016363507 /DNA_START=22 /DNA_END=1134 /DNA_ORIENTATION=+
MTDAGDDYVAEYTDHMDLLFEHTVCDPLVPYIPASVSPNTITLLNLVLKVIAVVLVLVGLYFYELDTPNNVGAAVVFALSAILSFVCMLCDYFDGMHARRTKQCSTFGMVFDHWVDSMSVPATSGILCQSACSGFVGDLTAAASAMILCAQMVKHTQSPSHVWIHPPIGGATAQIFCCVFVIAMSLLAYMGVSRSHWVTLLASSAVQLPGMYGCIYNVWFLCCRMKEEFKIFLLHMFSYGSLILCYTWQQWGGGRFNSWNALVANETFLADSLSPSPAIWLTPLSFYLVAVGFSLHQSGGLCLYHAAKMPPKRIAPGLDAINMGYSGLILLLTLMQADHPLLFYLPYVVFLHLVVDAAYDLVNVKKTHLS